MQGVSQDARLYQTSLQLLGYGRIRIVADDVPDRLVGPVGNELHQEGRLLGRVECCVAGYWLSRVAVV
jgi:hypothetical protein